MISTCKREKTTAYLLDEAVAIGWISRPVEVCGRHHHHTHVDPNAKEGTDLLLGNWTPVWVRGHPLPAFRIAVGLVLNHLKKSAHELLISMM